MEKTTNGIRPQDVSRIMRNAGLMMSKDIKQKICYISTAGWNVRKNFDGSVQITWNIGHWRNGREQENDQREKLNALLFNKNFEYEIVFDRFIITGKVTK